MPDILIRQANIAALSTVRPFAENNSNWRFRRCPYPRGLYTILVRSDGAAGVMSHAVLIGTTEVVQRSDTPIGLADGVMPTPAGATATPAHQFYAEAGDEIVLELTELGNVATTDVMIWANVEPS
ncbi:MAG: hypothetical protein ACREJC_22480 [Tepidisphaeraceae bacterium]